jgi:hypothetical protein
MKWFFIPVFFMAISPACTGQVKKDSVVWLDNRYVTLKEVVIDTKLNVPAFIRHVKNDSSFYKAFKNLRVIGFTAINDIRMLNSNQQLKASLHSRTKQKRIHDCRVMEVLEESTTGDIYDENHLFNYYTGQMYASLFFTKDTICGETNIIGNSSFSTEGKTGMEKHKEQLKMLFFSPGSRIRGLPFMSKKTAIFDDDIADCYDMSIDMDFYNNNSCYVFKQKVKPGKRDGVVVDEMTTWFNDSTFEVVARNYSLSYDAAVYDFKVSMEVMMTKFGDMTVPSLIRYNGNWKAIFKKRERGIFTATLFDFE